MAAPEIVDYYGPVPPGEDPRFVVESTPEIRVRGMIRRISAMWIVHQTSSYDCAYVRQSIRPEIGQSDARHPRRPPSASRASCSPPQQPERSAFWPDIAGGLGLRFYAGLAVGLVITNNHVRSDAFDLVKAIIGTII